MDRRIRLKIIDKVIESEDTITFVFEYELKAKPCQFIMITDYENGEKPFSLSDCNKKTFSVSIKRAGNFTSKLFNLDKGNHLIIRGPYGKPFTINNPENKNVLITGGGCGVAPLRFLAKTLLQLNADITFINGAKTKNQLIFANEFDKLNKIDNLVCTDDGTYGYSGTAVNMLENVLNKSKFDMIYIAGPELMMKSALDILKDINIPCEFLLERYMKCAIGICGQCTMDPSGIRMCVEGPVFDKETLLTFKEFSHYKRDASGSRVYF